MMAQNWIDVPAEALEAGRLNEDRNANKRCKHLARVQDQRLMEVRECSGLNECDVANRLGVSQVQVSRIEWG